MKRFARIASVASFAIVFAGGGCSVPPQNDPAALTVGVVGDFAGLDPALHPSAMSFAAAREVMETLVRLRPGSFEIAPGIAQSWRVAADRETWTFELRPGAKFSDGTVLDAAAVQANFDRWRNSSDARHWSHDYPSYIERFGGVDAQSAIDTVSVVNPTEVLIHTRVPMGNLLHVLTLPAFSIGSPTAMSNDRQVYEDLPTGSGPYVFADYAGGDHVTLGPSSQQIAAAPAIATIVMRGIPDPPTSLLALEKDDVDVIPMVPPSAAGAMAGNPDVRDLRWPSNATCYLSFLADRAPFDVVAARQGVARALDLTKISTFFDLSPAVPATTWLAPGMLGFDGSATSTPFDPDGARAMLEKANASAVEVTLVYPNDPTTLLPHPKETAQEIARELSVVGLIVKTRSAEVAPNATQQNDGVLTLGVVSSDSGDPDDLIAPLATMWHDPGLAARAIDGRSAVGDAKRADIYRNVDAYIANNTGAIPLIHPSDVAGISVRASIPSRANTLPAGVLPPAPSGT